MVSEMVAEIEILNAVGCGFRDTNPNIIKNHEDYCWKCQEAKEHDR